jgi:hypothetical protein
VLDDVWIESALWKEGVFRQMEMDLEIGTEVLDEGSAAWRRVEETRQFFAFAREELARMMERWRSRRAELRLRAPHARGSSGRSK